MTDSEILVRILVAPQHVNGKGMPRAASLTDAERGGLSLLRESQAQDCHYQEVAQGLVDKARRSQGTKAGVFGVLRVQCSVVRKLRILDCAKRCYCVYDTALEENTSHSEIFQCLAQVEEEIKEERRRTLFAAVSSTFIKTADFRNGLLSYLAPKN